MYNKKMKKRVLTIIFLGIVCITYAENVKKSVDNLRLDNNDDNGENDDAKDVAMEIPENEPENNKINKTQLCSARKHNHRMHPILNATAHQFPFMASCLSLSEEHLCSCTVISNGMLLTTASCVQKQINLVLINTISTNKKNPNAIRLPVIKSEKFPSYTGEESINNVGIVYTYKHNASVASKIRISNYTSAQNLVDLEIYGFGLNEPAGFSEVLQYVGVEHRFQEQPGNLLHVYIDCVESKETTCFTDHGGPALFGNELVGIIVSGSDNCIQEMSANYAINKEMATILPTYTFKSWLDEKIKAHEESNVEAIPTFPQKLVEANSRLVETPTDKAPNALSASIFVVTLLFVPTLL